MNKLSLASLTLMIVAAIDSIRNLPIAALFGSSLIFFFLFSAAIFLIPISLVAAEFSSRYPEEGGVFHWVRRAFGERTGMLAIWLQWINTMVWYPTILLFIAGTASHLVDPALAQNKTFLIATTLAVFWTLTLVTSRGIRASARINAICAIAGTLLPMAALIALGLFWAGGGNPIQIGFSASEILPSFSGSENWISLIAIMASFLGMELAGVHVNDMENPQKNFPRAMGISVAILLSTMLLGSLAIAAVVPKTEIRLVDGIMQTFSGFFASLGISWCAPLLAFLILIGTAGSMISWLLSPAKGLLQAAEHGFLPPYLATVNRHNVPVRILLAQGAIVTLLSLALILMPSVNGFYWFLTCLSTELYMVMYVLIFAAALKLGRPQKDSPAYRIPRGIRRLFCLAGLSASFLTIAVGFLPPPDINVGGSLAYLLLVTGGSLLAIAPVVLLWIYWEKRRAYEEAAPHSYLKTDP